MLPLSSTHYTTESAKPLDTGTPTPLTLLTTRWLQQSPHTMGRYHQQPVASVIEDLDLCILNTIHPTHYHMQTDTQPFIDLSLGSPDAYMDFTWGISEDLHRSDIYPIFISHSTLQPSPRLPRWKLDRADWELFRTMTHTETSIDDFDATEDPVNFLTAHIHRAGELTIPQTTGHASRRSLPCWSDE